MPTQENSVFAFALQERVEVFQFLNYGVGLDEWWTEAVVVGRAFSRDGEPLYQVQIQGLPPTWEPESCLRRE